MEINIEAVNKLIQERFRNNKTWFAEEMKVNYSYVNGILNRKRKASSPKLCKGLASYCKKNKLDYRKYIFLP